MGLPSTALTVEPSTPRPPEGADGVRAVEAPPQADRVTATKMRGVKAGRHTGKSMDGACARRVLWVSCRNCRGFHAHRRRADYIPVHVLTQSVAAERLHKS